MLHACARRAARTLVNNLDLEVRAEGLGNKLLSGNVFGSNYLAPDNGTPAPDEVNNVESVRAPSIEHVEPRSLP